MDTNTYGIGGNELPRNADEALTDIPDNRTLLIESLTNEPAVRPEVVEGLKSTEEVFEHYKPKVEIEFKNREGRLDKEVLNFRSLGDFGADGLSRQSNFLKNLTTERDEYQKIIRQTKSNKVLRKVLADEGQRAAFLKAIKALIQELEQSNI